MPELINSRDMNGATIRFRALPGTLNEQERTVEAIMATEEPCRTWYSDAEVLLAKGAEFPDQIPLLDSHMRYETNCVLGSVRNIRVEGSRIIGTLTFSQSTEKARETFDLVREGHLTDVSVGYRVHEYVSVREGTSAMVEGTNYEGPVDVAVRWTGIELSVTPIGADREAKIRSEAGLINQKTEPEARNMTKKNEPEVTEPTANKTENPPAEGERKAAEPEQTRQEPTAKPEPAKAPEPVDRDEIRAEEAEKFRARSIEITDLGKLAGIDQKTILDEINGARSIAEIRADFVAKHEKENKMPEFGVSVERDGDETTVRALTDGMLVRAGVLNLDADEKSGRKAHDAAREYAGYGPWALVEHMAQKNGIRTLGVSRTEVMRQLSTRTRAMTGTGSFSYILANALNKTLGVEFREAPTTWQRWCKRVPLNDLREKSINRISEMERLGIVGENGEVRSGTISDEKEAYTPEMYAKRFSVTDKLIINDDLGAIVDIPRRFAQATARTIEELVYYTFLSNPTLTDGTAVFHSDHGNVGSSGAFSDTTVNDAESKMMVQTAPGGTPLSLSPKYILVPPAIKGTVSTFLNSKTLVGETNDVTNQWYQLYEMISVPYLQLGATVEKKDGSTASVSGSATAYYFVAESSQVDTMEVGFVDNISEPRLDSERPIEILGEDFRASLPGVGVGFGDYRGFIKNAGT